MAADYYYIGKFTTTNLFVDAYGPFITQEAADAFYENAVQYPNGYLYVRLQASTDDKREVRDALRSRYGG